MSIEVVESLNLDDLDDVEFIEEVEQSFSVWFGEGPVSFSTVAELVETVAGQLDRAGKPGKCATSMTFYRLRRAAEAEFGSSPRPETPLAQLLGDRHKQAARALAARSGLRIDGPPLSWRGCIGLLACLAGLLWTLVYLSGWLGFGAGVALFVGGVVLVRTDPGRYSIETFGDLVRETAAQNMGLLIREGADGRRAIIEAAVIRAASRMSGVPEERIGPQTHLWPIAAKDAA